jgi:hypothetical protein
MEQRFKSLSIFEFQDKFASDIDSTAYLAELKWKNGYKCRRCGHQNHCDGHVPYSRKCTSCTYIETPTANTLFHRIRFSLRKAFWIVYYVSTNKKGITSTELARKLEMRQKTAWAFKRKVMKAMKSSGNHPITGRAEVDETVVGGQESGTRGRQNKKKKLVAVAIEKKGNGISRLYARHIDKADAESLGGFMKDHIALDADVKTDKWNGYTPLEKDFSKLKRIPSGEKGGNFPEMHRTIMMFKAWLRGTHQYVWHLQDYLDKYCYRFNRSFMKGEIFDNLLNRMVAHPPCYIRNLGS